MKDDIGVDTFDPTRADAAVGAVRAAAPDVAVGVTTGVWAEPDPIARVAAIRAWTVLPDFASVNWHEPGAEDVARCLLERGIGVEAGLWQVEAVAQWLAWPLRNQCLRVLVELPADLPAEDTPTFADTLLDLLAGINLQILLHGQDSSCWPALKHAGRRGLATRIGLEDTLVMSDGSPATDNAALVVDAVKILS